MVCALGQVVKAIAQVLFPCAKTVISDPVETPPFGYSGLGKQDIRIQSVETAVHRVADEAATSTMPTSELRATFWQCIYLLRLQTKLSSVSKLTRTYGSIDSGIVGSTSQTHLILARLATKVSAFLDKSKYYPLDSAPNDSP